jgi:ABC-2 type transport system permease protein
MIMRFAIALFRINLQAAFALRGAFWLQAGLMLVNNLLFFVFWWVLFERFEEIRGWRIGDVAVLYGVTAAGYGLAAILAGGVQDLARRIEGGELDPMLTLPRSVLVQAAGARTRPDGWGDVASGIILVAMSGHLHGIAWVTAPLSMVCAGVVFAAAGVVLHSGAFWLGAIEGLARQVYDLMLTFAVYPPTLFGWQLKLLFFTVLPAGFVGHLPAELVRSFDLGTLLVLVAGTIAWAALAWWLFERGLRHYASGSRFGVRD